MSDGASKRLQVNNLDEEGLMLIPGVGSSLARTIVMLRHMNGDLDANLLSALCRSTVDENTLSTLDFRPSAEFQTPAGQQNGINTSPTTAVGMGEPDSPTSLAENIGGAAKMPSMLTEHSVSAFTRTLPDVPVNKPSRLPNMTSRDDTIQGVSFLQRTAPMVGYGAGVNRTLLNNTMGTMPKRTLPQTPVQKLD